MSEKHKIDGEEIPHSMNRDIESLIAKWSDNGESDKKIYATLLIYAAYLVMHNIPVGWREEMVDNIKSLRLER